jgi:hypothetical protein
MKTLTLFITFVLSASSALSETAKVTIYYVPWSVKTAQGMKPENVRSSAASVTTISQRHYAQRFVEWLGEEKMKKDPELMLIDFRVIIDATQDDGSVVTYCVSEIAIVSEKTGKARKVDSEFRSRISYYHE